jgi:hypothetical protein
LRHQEPREQISAPFCFARLESSVDPDARHERPQRPRSKPTRLAKPPAPLPEWLASIEELLKSVDRENEEYDQSPDIARESSLDWGSDIYQTPSSPLPQRAVGPG